MVTVPAFVWRYGYFLRVVLCGIGFAAPLAVLAWIDSGMWLAAVIVLVVLAVFFGLWMARRMSKFWPESKTLTGPERALIARAVRRGDVISGPPLAQPVLDYHRGLHASAEKIFPFRWLVWLVLSIGVAVTLWDAVFESPRNAISSGLYLAILVVEVFWWPKFERQLLANADRAAGAAQEVRTNFVGGSN